MSDPDIRLNDLIRPEAGSFLFQIKDRFWPEGTFAMAVDMARAGVTHNGKVKIDITLLCTRGELAGDFYSWDLTLDPGNPDYFLSRLNTMGASGEFLKSNPTLSEICGAIVSAQEYWVTFKDSRHKGRRTTNISYLERV